MNSVYDAPKSDVTDKEFTDGNNSGLKEDFVPEGIKGFCWGGFFLNWIWGLFNKSYIALLVFLPFIGFLMCFYLGFKGRELAWKNKRWDSVEHFNKVQRRWSIWGFFLTVIPIVLIIVAVAIPAYVDYTQRAAEYYNNP